MHALVDRDVPERAVVEVHERLKLLRGPREVLGGEGVDGEDVDADIEAPVEQLLHRLAPFRVALRDVQALGDGEPTVPVHDDGQVVGDGLRAHELEEALLGQVPERVADRMGEVRGSAVALRAVGVGHAPARPRRRIRGRAPGRERPRARGRPGAGSALVGSSGPGVSDPRLLRTRVAGSTDLHPRPTRLPGQPRCANRSLL